MGSNAGSTTRPMGWSEELQDLQDETIRLLHTIRGTGGSRQGQQASGQPSREGGNIRNKTDDGGVKGEVSRTRKDRRKPSRRRRRRRGAKRLTSEAILLESTNGQNPTGLELNGPRRFSYTLDTSRWPGGDENGTATKLATGTRKTTVEVLDRGEDTPRSQENTPRSQPPTKAAEKAKENATTSGSRPSTKTSSFTSRKSSQVAGVATTAGEGERRYRSLTFKEEEGRVRDGFDTYASTAGGVGEGLRGLKAERDRLASIEEAQRETYRGTKRQEFHRFARRKWLARDRAAEAVQRVFRGHLGRRRAGLTAEVRKISGEANAEWVEVRDNDRGEAWYFNPHTGKSQWDRPESLVGTITPAEKVKTLPALGPSSPSKQRSSPVTAATETENQGGLTPSRREEVRDRQNQQSPVKKDSHSNNPTSIGDTGVRAPGEGSRLRGRAQTAPNLPPLMKGSRHSVLVSSSAAAALPGTGGELQSGGVNVDGVGFEMGKGQKEAWVEEGAEQYPFLTEDDLVLPDDQFEETGLGLAKRREQEHDHSSSDNSDDDEGKSRAFFLADGTPNIRLRRTIAKALRVTKFDSVSTLLADYTGRKALSASKPSKNHGGTVSNTNNKIDADEGDAGTQFLKSARGGSRKRSRKNAGSPSPTYGSNGFVYPNGKLEDDKEPALFASSPEKNGRKMISVMTVGKSKQRNKRADGTRRVKTAAGNVGASGGHALKGLAIRDLTAPGFQPPAGVSTPPEGIKVDAVGGDGSQTSRVATPAVAGGSAVANVGEASVAGEQKPVKEICFNCWSKGSGKTCTLHKMAATAPGLGTAGKAGEARPAESAVMCKNWDVGVMRRRYRSEELQEIFAKKASSLRYDKERKKFVSIVEQRHPIYRLLARILSAYNFTVRRRQHQKNWLRALVEQLRMGKLSGEDEGGRVARTLRLRNTLQNSAQVKAFTTTARPSQPQPPITGSTLAERCGLVRVLVDRPSSVMGRETRVVLDGPTPVPQALYEPRLYTMPPAKTMPMPEPKYIKAETEEDDDNELETLGGIDGDGHFLEDTRAAWLERFCGAAAGDIVRSAATTVEVMSPVPGADELSRTKYPPTLTIKFATFSRKPTPGMLGVGGLPAEMVVHMLVSTRMPPQYGNFTVMQKSSVAPTISKEETAHYDSLELLVENQAFLPRALQHPLNGRKAPTVTLKTLMEDPTERHFFGKNRPEQTGEGDDHGFRTSAHADASPALPTLDPTAFTPSDDVVTPNLCSANRTVTTHADRSYPFCEPSNRSNTTLDFYHLLLTATCSPNKEQVFTNLGIQECGEFMRGSDPMRPMGHCIGVVYRSWAFLQRQVVEEFETDDGVSYWFDRRTGETFWERPLCDEEKVPVKEGGTVLGGQGESPDSSGGAYETIKPRYDQAQMRTLMMKGHEGIDALERRRQQVSTQVKWARESGALPPPDPDDLGPSPTSMDGDDLLSNEGDETVSSRGNEATSSRARGSASSPRRQNGSHNSPRNSPQNSRRGGTGCRRDRSPSSRAGIDGGPNARKGSEADRFAASIAEALADAGLTEGRPVKPSDMLRLGMGLGITLGANGLLNDFGRAEDTLGAERNNDDAETGRNSGAKSGVGQSGGFAGGQEASLAPSVVKISPNGHPIGHGHDQPTAAREDKMMLDHESEAQHLASIVRDSAELKTSEEFKGLVVVPPMTPSPCPDEQYGVVPPEDLESDPRRKAELSTPIIAYPETLWKKQYRGHGSAGEGKSWIPAGDDHAANQRAKSSLGAPMRRTNEPLPEGFLSAISHTHVGKQHCDYLPHVPNMPQARPVGRVRPRSAADDWFAVGFDPWSAGREPLSAEFIPTLSIKQADLGADEEGGISTVPQAGYLELKDSVGHAEMAIVSAEEAKMAADFEQITSWARHGRYADVENAMNQADWTMPIDYQNDLGVTILHIAAQNGNKRIAKLCLRRGADVNKRNNNGQTALHYAYSYGFESFGEYLISKGADDSITNADGLTCYEGLSQENLGNL